MSCWRACLTAALMLMMLPWGAYLRGTEYSAVRQAYAQAAQHQEIGEAVAANDLRVKCRGLSLLGAHCSADISLTQAVDLPLLEEASPARGFDTPLCLSGQHPVPESDPPRTFG